MVSTSLALLGALWLGSLDSPPAPASLEVQPAKAQLRGSDSLVQVAVTGRSADGKPSDYTASAKYLSRDNQVATVDADGLIRPVADGRCSIEVMVGGKTATIEIEVSDFANSRPVHFVGEVIPILSKHGCNAGGCHGKASGQNGFRLSLLGFDPRSDYEALVKEGRGRRVFPPAPAASLLLKKPTAQIPHGGGKKFAIGSPEYNTLVRWVSQGMPFGTGKEPELLRLSVEPSQRVIARKASQQLRVVAHYGDGSSTDVTRLAQYQSNAADLAEVDAKGTIRALDGIGEAAIMARFGGLVGVARATIPNDSQRLNWEPPASANFIDPLVFRKLRELGLSPSETCTDAEFARRSALDICGLLPKPAEVVAFENDTDPEKRARWVDRLIARPEYADLFALKWSAILKNKRGLGDVSQPGTFAFHGWIRQSLAENKPYDKFVAEIVAARGDAAANPAVVWYRQAATVEERADDTAQLFLGLRIQCARCHHHPFEKWSQDDYYGFASIFARVGTKAGADPTSPRIYNLPAGMASNPLTGEARKAKPLGAPEFVDGGPFRDPRVELVGWMRQADNPFFARAVVNRYWKHFLGRGLVEPEDDMRVSNPPSNPELLDALADDFVKNGYDLKRLVRTIATSRAYDRSSQPNASNEADRRNFARFYPRRLSAEVLLDAVGVVTGSRDRFAGLPEAFHSTQLPDDGFASYFLDVFGRPKRESVCECERSTEANLSQTLHLLNSDEINGKLTPDTARAAKLAADPRPLAEKVDELYRLALARRPTDDERVECLTFLAKHQGAGAIASRPGRSDLDVDQHERILVQSIDDKSASPALRSIRFSLQEVSSMLDIFGDRYGSCDGVSRRNFLRVGALGLGSLTLADLLRAQARAAKDGRSPSSKAVIQVVLSGGPSHMETYDPKPEAPTGYRTDVKAMPTCVPGIHVSDLMRGTARTMDKMAIVRSLTHETSDHNAGLHWILTGFASTQQQQNQNERPSVGSVVAKMKGSNGLGVPPYVGMSEGAIFGGLFQGGSYLGPGYNPFNLNGDPTGDMKVRNLEPPKGLTLDRLEDRKTLLAKLDTINRRRDLSGTMDGLDQFTAQAYEMVTGPSARQALDLGHEDPRLRDKYGRTRIGQNCLLARRLVEAGVTFVTIAEGNWDHHAQVAQNCRAQVPPLDAAVSALVGDLYDRGLAESVLVVVWGEFGRTPRLNGSGGRDHWPGSMSAMLAGGGLKMGQVVGATNRKGEQPTERPLRPEDVIRTIYHVLGIDPLHEFPNESGRPMAVMNRGRAIAELI